MKKKTLLAATVAIATVNILQCKAFVTTSRHSDSRSQAPLTNNCHFTKHFPIPSFPPSPSTLLYATSQNPKVIQQPLSEDETNALLTEVGRTLKLEIFDLDEGLYGYDSQDQRYGLEVIKATIPLPDPEDGIGLELTELASAGDGRGLVLVSGVPGLAAQQEGIHVGDAPVGVRVNDDMALTLTTGVAFRGPLAGRDYDSTIETLSEAKDTANQIRDRGGVPSLTLEFDRLVKRASVHVTVVDDATSPTQTIEALAGENLRRLLMRKGVKLYNSKTKRFDMPFATGDCTGEGLCGTCLVAIEKG